MRPSATPPGRAMVTHRTMRGRKCGKFLHSPPFCVGMSHKQMSMQSRARGRAPELTGLGSNHSLRTDEV